MVEQQLKLGEHQLQESKVALKRKRDDDLVQSYRQLKGLGVHLRQLYIKKCNLTADFKAFTKRETMFNGRPGLENTNYARNEDITEQAIREIMKYPAKSSQCIIQTLLHFAAA